MTMDIAEQYKILLEIQSAIATGNLTLGGAVKRLRTDVTGLSQNAFADMCGISGRTLLRIEKGDGNQTINTLSSILSLFGMHIGVVNASDEQNKIVV